MNEKLKIGGTYVGIEERNPWPDENTDGLWVQADSMIYLREGLEQSFRRNVVWHELAHNFIAQNGIVLSDKKEETLCSAFAAFITSFVEDNPDCGLLKPIKKDKK